jgi:hypothetical protein
MESALLRPVEKQKTDDESLQTRVTAELVIALAGVGSIYFDVDQLRIFPRVGIGMAILTRLISDKARMGFRNLEH